MCVLFDILHNYIVCEIYNTKYSSDYLKKLIKTLHFNKADNNLLKMIMKNRTLGNLSK